MRTFTCACSATIFFENSLCLACDRELGWCPACRAIGAIEPEGKHTYRCANAGCGVLLVKCHNYSVANVCNRCLVANETGSAPETFCDCCRYNETIPDLSVEGNREKWYRLEQAKRRMMYGLELAGLPFGKASDGFYPPLSFDFKADVVPPPDDQWHAIGDEETVYTGHADGKVTINIREADDVERERTRVEFEEKQRTLIGHFRHEMGHYYWDMFIDGGREDECAEIFGNHRTPTYDEALAKHYEAGPPEDWPDWYVSSYASMHPWEDFAETFAVYLDMVSALDTANAMGWSGPTFATTRDLEALVRQYQRLGIFMNEMNRAMGLIDYVPEVLNPRVIGKLRYIHGLVATADKHAMRRTA